MKKPYFVLMLISFLLPMGCNRMLWHEHLDLSGTLEMTEHSVGPKIPGRITTIRFTEGALVRQGQVLATLDHFEKAREDYMRVVWLYRQGGASRQAVEEAKLNLEDQRIVSPVEGVVLVKVHELGEIVSAGQAVAVIGDTTSWWVRVYVPEGKINRLAMGQPATVRFDGLSKSFRGHITFIATKAEFTPRNVQTPEERVTQTFAVKVTLDKPEPFFHAGVNADVRLSLNK